MYKSGFENFLFVNQHTTPKQQIDNAMIAKVFIL